MDPEVTIDAEWLRCRLLILDRVTMWQSNYEIFHSFRSSSAFTKINRIFSNLCEDRPMSRKILLSTLIMLGLLYINGYDFGATKRLIINWTSTKAWMPIDNGNGNWGDPN